MTRTPIPTQIEWLRVVASGRFAFASWDGDLNWFLELAGKNLESTMIEKWTEERVVEKVPGNFKVRVPGSRCSLNELEREIDIEVAMVLIERTV